MKGIARILLIWLALATRAESAFETLRGLSVQVAFDPIHQGLHYWHSMPQRLVDSEPRILLAAAQPYGLAALRTAAGEATFHPGPFGIGLSCTSLGQHDYYGELQVEWAVAIEIREFLAFGVAAHYGRVSFGRRFASLHELTAGAGVRLAFARRFSVDLGARGLGGAESGGRPLSNSDLTGGVTWDYSSDLSLRAGVGSGADATFGETVRLGPNLALAADLLTSPLRLQVGALMSAGRFGFDFLYRDHPELGGDLIAGILIRL